MKNYKNKKILVTGGAGFIGSHLVDALVSQNAQITILDNFSTGTLHNLTQSQSKIILKKGDIRNPKTCIQVSKECDIIFHLAACVSVSHSMQDPQFCYQANIHGTHNMLEAARINNINRFIFSSSCAVYGEKSRPCSESDTCNPTSPYAYSKYIGELLCQQYAKIFNVPSICLRYFNVIGTRQSPNGPYAGVYAKFSDQMQNNKPITIYGDGSQTRDFIPVEQVIKANMQLGLLPTNQCKGQAVNIGTGTTTSVGDIFKALTKKYPNYSHKPFFAPARKGDILHSSALVTYYNQLITESF